MKDQNEITMHSYKMLYKDKPSTKYDICKYQFKTLNNKDHSFTNLLSLFLIPYLYFPLNFSFCAGFLKEISSTVCRLTLTCVCKP